MDTSAAGRFGRDVLLAMAAFESEQKSETWKQAHSRRADLGPPTHGHKHFGYIKRRDGYDIDPQTAPLLKESYLKYISGNLEAWAAALPSDDAAKQAADDAGAAAQLAKVKADSAATDLQLMAVRQAWKDSDVASAMAVLKAEQEAAANMLQLALADQGSFTPSETVMEQIKRGLEIKDWWHDGSPAADEAQEWKALTAQIIKEVRCNPRAKGSEFSHDQIEVIAK